MPSSKDDKFSEQETARRRDAVIKQMISRPPKPHSEIKIGNTKMKKAASLRKKKTSAKVPPFRLVRWPSLLWLLVGGPSSQSFGITGRLKLAPARPQLL